MKKLFIKLFFCLMASAALQSAGLYNPAQGPLNFNGTGLQGQNTYGPIMQAVRNNNPNNLNVNQVLAQANADISAFDGRGQNFSSYQQIMTNLFTTTNTVQAIAALQGIEKVIMHLYNYKAYLSGSYDPMRSIFITGVRQSWFDLRYYGPKSWFSDNNLELKQLIDELENVALVMDRHSTVESMRLKAIVFSYRHWRATMALSIAAYLIADAYRYGSEQCIVNQFYQNGLKSTPGILRNVGNDVFYGVKNTGKGIGFAAGFGWKFIVKPVGKFVIGGKNGLKGQDKKSDVVENKNLSDVQIFKDVDVLPVVKDYKDPIVGESVAKAVQIDFIKVDDLRLDQAIDPIEKNVVIEPKGYETSNDGSFVPYAQKLDALNKRLLVKIYPYHVKLRLKIDSIVDDLKEAAKKISSQDLLKSGSYL